MGKANIFNTNAQDEIDPRDIIERLLTRADKCPPGQTYELAFESYCQALLDFEQFLSCDESAQQLINLLQARMSETAWEDLVEIIEPSDVYFVGYVLDPDFPHDFAMSFGPVKVLQECLEFTPAEIGPQHEAYILQLAKQRQPHLYDKLFKWSFLEGSWTEFKE